MEDSGKLLRRLFEGVDTPILVCQLCLEQRPCDGIECFTHLPLCLDEET